MPPSSNRSNTSLQDTVSRVKPSIAFVVMIFGALIAFEVFNYSTTDHALGDLLGSLTFAGIPWSTILALAFCGIDFAGIARLFTPEQGMDEPKEVWYLFAAWLLAATMNAILTWWGVSLAVANHSVQSSSVVDPQTISQIVPVFVAIMVWVIRILIIGTLSLSMDRLLHPGVEQQTAFQNAMSARSNRPAQTQQPQQPMSIPSSLHSSSIPQRPAVNRGAQASGRPGRYSPPPPPVEEEEDFTPETMRTRVEPSYHSLSASPRPQVNRGSNSGSNEGTGSNRFRRS